MVAAAMAAAAKAVASHEQRAACWEHPHLLTEHQLAAIIQCEQVRGVALAVSELLHANGLAVEPGSRVRCQIRAQGGDVELVRSSHSSDIGGRRHRGRPSCDKCARARRRQCNAQHWGPAGLHETLARAGHSARAHALYARTGRTCMMPSGTRAQSHSQSGHSILLTRASYRQHAASSCSKPLNTNAKA